MKKNKVASWHQQDPHPSYDLIKVNLEIGGVTSPIDT